MVRSIFLLALLVSPSLAFLTGQRQGWVPNLSRQSPSKLARSESLECTSQDNMFHDYDKPIVLIGSSGEGNELNRLADDFLRANFPNHANNQVVHPTANLVQEIQDFKYGWPNVVVVDFSADTMAETDSAALAQSLYEAGLLSIYVNVDPVQGKFSPDATDQKQRLEKDTFVQNTDYELCIKDEGIVDEEKASNKWEHIVWELTRLIARARLAPAVPGETTPTANTAHLTMGENTFFLSLSFPEISQAEPYVEEMCVDVDAMEYRADLLNCRDNRFELLYGMQLLRRYCRRHVVRVPALPFSGRVLDDVMPTVYTVRTENQAGTYPDDDAGISTMFNMLNWGLRGGVEVLDVESAWDKDKTDALLSHAKQRYSSQILGSHHVVGKEVSMEEAVSLFHQCALDGRAHGAKVVLSIETKEKDRMAHEAALAAASLTASQGKPVIPNVSLILGETGQFSRVINLPFTPVTHESLPFKAAPGQLTASEIMASRILMNIVRSKRYAILGHNIAYSVSPQMQGSAFSATRLPHQYGRADVSDVKEFVESDFFKDESFGGCSVTIPHKQAIIPYVDVMSDSAQKIGSVNTLIVKEDLEGDDRKRVIHGDNTDWRGIFNPLERRLGVQSEESASDFALILGGGGTARAASYAASKLGLRRLYFNRTPSKAVDLAESFGGVVLSTLDSEGEGSLGEILSASQGTVRAVISTLPAAAGFVLPEWLLDTESSHAKGERPVVLDVNYKPFHTKLLSQATDTGCEVVRGSEMLWEQGAGQFELWTQRPAPYGVMKAIVLQNCLPQETQDAHHGDNSVENSDSPSSPKN